MVAWKTLFPLALVLACCSGPKSAEEPPMGEDGKSPRLVLPLSLEARRKEFQGNIGQALGNISTFARRHGWASHTRLEFMDSVMIFDDKRLFNKTLLKLAGADSTIELPATYCAALEKRVLIAMSPEYYARVYPEGIESESYTKLLTHEIAHRLHIRILGGDEEAMGPTWFFEGFAIYAADQFSASDITLTNGEMARIMGEPERGSYALYAFIFRRFVRQIPLKELIDMAKREDFNEALIRKLD